MAKDLRIVELFEDGEWTKVRFRELNVDDQFRMFESTGEAVNEGEIFKATSIPFINSDGVYTIRIRGGKYEKGGN